MASLAFSPTEGKARETCPHCRWSFISQPCCDRTDHNVGVVCPRCKGISMSSATPPISPPPTKEPTAGRYSEMAPRWLPRTPGPVPERDDEPQRLRDQSRQESALLKRILR